MADIASSPQSDALERLLAERQLSDPARRALSQVRELERELTELRRTLSDATANQAMPDAVSRDQVANLLSRIMLFRIALADH